MLRLRYRADVLDAGRRPPDRRLSPDARSAIWSPTPRRNPPTPTSSTAEERRLQLEQLAGPERPRPQRRFHELFEERVRQHPERIAAVQDAREWTYAELNARANRIARALHARGLRAEDIVAVVAERDLEWMAAVIGIFKAGGAYLPIEPHFPADRIARTLTRAGARMVLTEGGSTTTLDEALARNARSDEALRSRTSRPRGTPPTTSAWRCAPDQLAYVYFTSGSTGEPKGAMCEHDGMVNHLYAKIEDLGDRPGRRRRPDRAPVLRHLAVAAGRRPCSSAAAPSSSTRTAILDVERFVDTVERGEAAVFQVVPSYLDAMVAYLEQQTPRPAATSAASRPPGRP